MNAEERKRALKLALDMQNEFAQLQARATVIAFLIEDKGSAGRVAAMVATVLVDVTKLVMTVGRVAVAISGGDGEATAEQLAAELSRVRGEE